MATESTNVVDDTAGNNSARVNPIVFNNPIGMKLDLNNFLVWRKQVLSTARGHDLQDFLLSSTGGAPVKFAELGDEELEVVTPAYRIWERQDQLLVSWLLSSMTEGVLTRMVNCDTAAQIWKTLEVYFAQQIRAKVSQFKTQLSRTKKIDITMNEYLLKIRNLVDLLVLVGESYTERDHVEAICEGLPDEYETFILATSTHNDKFSVDEIEALLLAQEARIEKKSFELDLPQSKSSKSFSANYSSMNSHYDRRGGGSGYQGQKQSFNGGGYNFSGGPQSHGYNSYFRGSQGIRGAQRGRGRGFGGRGF